MKENNFLPLCIYVIFHYNFFLSLLHATCFYQPTNAEIFYIICDYRQLLYSLPTSTSITWYYIDLDSD